VRPREAVALQQAAVPPEARQLRLVPSGSVSLPPVLWPAVR
jgi:hypothetical protein